MIVPANRLLVWFGIVVVPFAALGVAVPEVSGISMAMIGVFLIVAAADAARARTRLGGISVEFPETVRLTKDREGSIVFLMKQAGRKPARLRLGLPFPPELETRDEDLRLVLPPAGQTSRFPWPCTPRQRGQYLFDACYVESGSPLGLWAVRTAVPIRTEVRVYPNLLAERKNLAALFLNRGNFGLHAQRQVGQGREFEKLREYVHGDSYDQIHWKTTAKRGRPVTKVFQIERTQEVYVVIDASRLSARPTLALPWRAGDGNGHPDHPETLLERFITASLILGVAAERQGDLFGVVTFSDHVHRFIRAKSGRTHYNTCRDALYRLHPRTVTPDFDELCSLLGLRLRRRALLIFLTNLDDPVLMESFERNLDILRRKHLVLVAMLRPHGVQPLFANPRAESLDDLYRDLGGHIFWHNLRELDKALQRKGVHFSLLTNEQMCAQLVSRYLGVKQRQLL